MSSVWIEEVSIAPPRVPDRDTWSTERRVYPSEVYNTHFCPGLLFDLDHYARLVNDLRPIGVACRLRSAGK